MKIFKWLKKYWKKALLFIAIMVIVYVIVYLCFCWNGFLSAGIDLEKKDWLSFLGAYLAFVGTVAVSVIALTQNSEYNRLENERRAKERFEKIQPIFVIDMARNVQIKGSADVVNPKTGSGTTHNNIELCIENVNEYPVMHLIIFDEYIQPVLKPGEKLYLTCAYYDSIDIKKWPKLLLRLTDDYERTDGNIPSWFNICYEDIDGHGMFQTFEINKFDTKYYYSLSAREYAEDVSVKTTGLEQVKRHN